MKKALFWFRRDLRLEDNCGLSQCLADNDKVASIFLFDKSSLYSVSNSNKKVEFLWGAVQNLKLKLQEKGSDLVVIHNNIDGIVSVAKKLKVTSVYCNEEYEPEAINRDSLLKYLLAKEGITFRAFRDLSLLKSTAIQTPSGGVVENFQDFYQAWKGFVLSNKIISYDSESNLNKLAKFKWSKNISLKDLGFEESIEDSNFKKSPLLTNLSNPYIFLDRFKEKVLPNYKQKKDYPSIDGTSFLSAYNRLGIISYRKQIKYAVAAVGCPNAKIKASAEAWLEHLARREFYFQLMYNYPDLTSKPFRMANRVIPWENDMVMFHRWCEGKTGFPLIDAAMTQLNTTGYMHNKMRVLTSSFLVKILLIDYRFGEEYFASKLLDFDLAVNNSGWQWSASCGVESQMANRVLNPAQQISLLDPLCKYIQKYLPIFKGIPPSMVQNPIMHEEELLCMGVELGVDYPYPVVDFKTERERAIQFFTIKMF